MLLRHLCLAGLILMPLPLVAQAAPSQASSAQFAAGPYRVGSPFSPAAGMADDTAPFAPAPRSVASLTIEARSQRGISVVGSTALGAAVGVVAATGVLWWGCGLIFCKKSEFTGGLMFGAVAGAGAGFMWGSMRQEPD